MVKIDSTLRKINEIDEIGRENLDLMPKVEGWCEHVKVEGYMRGMVAEMKRIPNHVSMTCPHAAFPSEWYKISDVAEQFIAQNCLNCVFHKTLREPNYGQVLLEKIKRQAKEKGEQQQIRAELSQKIKEETDALVATGTKSANPTQLSILKMLANLVEDAGKIATAAQLSAAAQLDPTFFSDAALDILLMYFDDEHVGKDCIDAACAVMAGKNHFPDKVFKQAKELIKTSRHFDRLSIILAFYIEKDNIREHLDTIDTLIAHLWYKRFIGESAKPDRDFKNSENFLISLGKTSPDVLAEMFRKNLSINDKNRRINTNLLLQNLAETLPGLVGGLTKELVKSLELDDDEYEQSADQTTLETLQTIILIDPKNTFETITSEKAKLSIAAKAVMVRLAIKLLGDRAFADHQPLIVESLVEELVGNVLNKNIPEEIKKETRHELSYFIHDRPELFQSRFDGFLGYLSQVAEEESLFKYYRDELENKEPHEYATFNYLVGKGFFEVDNIKHEINSRYQEIKKILGELCKDNPGTNLPKVYSIIPEINSVKNEKYKLELISIVKDYGKDPATIAGFIPQLYQHLLDPDSMNIRFSALKFLDVVFDNFQMLVTSSLWELFEVFLKDKEPAIKGMALTILGTIARKYPERITTEHLKIHKEALYNNYVFIHSTAIDIADELQPFMDAQQRYDMIGILLRFAEIFARTNEQNNKSIFSTVVDQALRFVSDQPTAIYKIAAEYIVPKTKTEEYYTAKEQIEKLEHLAKRTPTIKELWLDCVLAFLIRFPEGGASQNDRLDFYFDMHHLDRSVIVGQEAQLRQLLTKNGAAMQTHFDIAHTLDLLAYFEWYDLIVDITYKLKLQYPNVESNKRLLRIIDFWSLLAISETTAETKDKLNNLKAAENVFETK